MPHVMSSCPVRFQTLVATGVVCLLVATVGAGCAKVRVANVEVAAPLAVPPPPERVIPPPDIPLPAEASVPETPVPAIAPATPRPQPPRRAGGNVPDPGPPEPPAPAATGPTPPDPSRELRAAPSAADAQAERMVRETLGRSTRDLGRVNVARLSADGRAQFEQARRFAQQAEQALGSRNFVFAATLADKAASLAADLVGR
jgi:hypothetical protein